ncbi:hypothetical protein MCOR27_007158 [Pyricularia oryzae]|uniref:Uncharacterized protein n=5 Tax=Pyricularia TaxID=48558 RepID=A0ABQ8NXG7_PYRGI|nr:uncharacterized protein MGG_17712 [Pyricularia oryzae 70-15]ELQ39120.1 hypothetical protein OOU_Y34scaffold00514g37 [Pyricularia oryzae Y34]KAH8846004.1 hypothetical protein MCOR01_003217 [Pyricularia oryzae]KAI6303535.1 hypothetical protein MCOR33_001414 [Pyricularia grisea]EHA47497.1 hypothetical protein MGG_17712 [Pyricularia oryzae 70-15]KAH9432492.1 hypothetical protein MCOR02_007187 [Pyricularia oryzae]
MPSQRPFFLTSVFAAFRQQTQPLASTSSQQPGKQSSTSTYSTAAVARSTQSQQQSSATSSSSQQQTQPSTAASQHHQQSSPGVQSSRTTTGAATSGIPIPAPGRRRGSDSSTEGFQNVRGAEKWYVGGRTATGEERFFRLGVIRRVRSGDRLSLDRLSL